MKYTGERVTETEGNITEAKLYYQEASKYVRGHTLDAACGVGHGSNILSGVIQNQRNTNRYVGGDINMESILHAQERYQGMGRDFFQMDITNLSWDECFETYVSIESIEHVPETQLINVFNSAHRVLKNGGLYFISTPDYDVIPYRPTCPAEIRGFHYRHYRADELRNALRMFSSVEIYKLFPESSLIVRAIK